MELSRIDPMSVQQQYILVYTFLEDKRFYTDWNKVKETPYFRVIIWKDCIG